MNDLLTGVFIGEILIIMREVMLIFHFIGLAMGVGAPFVLFFIERTGAKLGQPEQDRFVLNGYRTVVVGHIGITLSLISGGYLMTPYWKVLPDQPLLIAKLALFLFFAAALSMISVLSRKAMESGDRKQLKKTITWGRITMLTGLVIIVLAVLVFR